MSTTNRPLSRNHSEPIALDERTRRVLELKKQIREGTYRPDPREVARAILAEWFEIGLQLEREAETPEVETAAGRRQAAARFIVEPGKPEAASEDAALTA